MSGAPQTIAQNRRARFDYEIEETLEAGLVLTGSEVKSLRLGKGTISQSYAGDSSGEIYLFNANIPVYAAANRFNHEPRRPRKILLHKRQVNRLLGLARREGYTLVPVRLYFSARGMVKIELGLAKGKKQQDKRQTIKDRDWNRQKGRLMRLKG